MSPKHNEDSRVKIPAILHLCRLGYSFLPLKSAKWEPKANIFTDIFAENIARLNPDLKPEEIARLLEDILSELDYEDLGKTFFHRLISNSGVKLVDFDNFRNNALHVVTELPCVNDGNEFRPDITLLVNGMPLAFVEVKKPNNLDGILAERKRINDRFKQKKNRRFINISQLLVFSNNMEYDSESVEPIQGAFYATTSKSNAIFNNFREEESLDLETLLAPLDDALEDLVLKVTNLPTSKHSPELATNKHPNTPTNRILTSLFTPDRLSFLLKYGLVYVTNQEGEIEKHIMRYPQMFATKAIEKKLDAGIKKGVIWHTQGSGKTALSYFNVPYLTDYFSRQQVVPKFYFIVDRIDLRDQAKSELSSRGLVVNSVDTKEGFAEDFKKQQAIHNATGQKEITVVNIHKFSNETAVLPSTSYNIATQRIYFIDEAHRSYKSKDGEYSTFLVNLITSDRNAIFIGLTGTPLIGKAGQTTDIFGTYIHKYYYNASIADGYTLRLIREGIESNYRMQMDEILKGITIEKGSLDSKQVHAHDRFAEPMLDYIVRDFVRSRDSVFADHSIGGMVVCHSADQAKKLFEIFMSKYNPNNETLEPVNPFTPNLPVPVEYQTYEAARQKPLTASLILHDIGNETSRKDQVTRFKAGEFDLLFVYSMLLTGFDAKRLKKLYLGRVIRAHGLLQTLTRVNRPYKNNRYGYVVDFADITKEFKDTNEAYFKELNSEFGADVMESFSNLFKSKEEIEAELRDIMETLFEFDLKNPEIFCQQITQIKDRAEILKIKKALESARELHNLIRLVGHADLLEKTDFALLGKLYNQTADRLNSLNLKDAIENNLDTTNLLNTALENITFHFNKTSEQELRLADELHDELKKTREALASNFDQKDPQFTNLYDELKRLFANKKLDEVTQDEMIQNIKSLQSIFDRISELNRKNNLLKAKYNHDAKFARLHKRLQENPTFTLQQTAIFDILTALKAATDERVLNNSGLFNNETYFDTEVIRMVIANLGTTGIKLDPASAKFIGKSLSKEYMDEYKGNSQW